ncbi:hypothetical protein MTR_7g071883 [Medicago truncatula]|uniref:Uncharacterized protein n=1 Tax=Medicago truncatula TaxID=3880 RepID=A0A072U0N8_MEDTR|nr:hypothetical protein MTR_7g071883 [Medicago truncatula]
MKLGPVFLGPKTGYNKDEPVNRFIFGPKASKIIKTVKNIQVFPKISSIKGFNQNLSFKTVWNFLDLQRFKPYLKKQLLDSCLGLKDESNEVTGNCMNSPEKMKFPADLQGLRRSFILAGGEILFTKLLICLKILRCPKATFAFAFVHIMHHVHHSSSHKRFPSAHCLLVLLPQIERWLVLGKFTNQTEYTDQGKLTFENNVPHVVDNPLPNHAAVNMIEVYEEAPGLDVRNVTTPLSLMNNNHLTVSDVCVIVPVFHDPPVKSVPSKENVEPLVIRLPGPVPYTSTKAIPYKYNAT